MPAQRSPPALNSPAPEEGSGPVSRSAGLVSQQASRCGEKRLPPQRRRQLPSNQVGAVDVAAAAGLLGVALAVPPSPGSVQNSTFNREPAFICATEEVAKLQKHLALLRQEYVKMQQKLADTERRCAVLAAQNPGQSSPTAAAAAAAGSFISRLLDIVADLYLQEQYR